MAPSFFDLVRLPGVPRRQLTHLIDNYALVDPFLIVEWDHRIVLVRTHDQEFLAVAHRREILDQSLATFRVVLRDGAFGEQLVAGRRPNPSNRCAKLVKAPGSSNTRTARPAAPAQLR